MTRLLLLALIPLAVTGCRSSCNRSSLLSNPCKSQATPVSYGYGAPVMTTPASFSNPVPVGALPATTYPMVPPPNMNATELPFPTEAASAAPNPTRSVGLPK